MAIELAKAYVQVIPSAEGISGMLSSQMEGEADAAGKSSGGKFSGAFATAAKAGLAAVTAASGAVATLAKDAIGNYAEYEQLVGGLETMFEDLSYDVELNANKAFQTAGISANEYMNTVMGFSAALNQSLTNTEGNIARAADLSDQIIIDMADNANKMGSDMSSIQTAYQGFAKQNYTMLDNLKLGYGGTKEEMQRLLDDAAELSGMEFDISNFSDIAEAIHVIQTEMGITGTTAKEASTTIQGSVSAMKSSWSNMMTGIADENADFGSLVENFVGSVTTVGDNLVPRLEQALSGVGKLVEGLAPVIASALPTIVTGALPAIQSAAMTLITTAATAILENLPMIAETAMELLISLANGISENLPTLIPTIVSVLLQIIETLTNPDAITQLVEAALAIITGLMEGLIEAIPTLLEAVPEIISNLVDALLASIPMIIETGVELLIALIDNLPLIISTIIEAMPKIIDGIVNGLTDHIGDIIEAGVKLIEALIKNLPQAIVTIVAALPEIITSIVNGLLEHIGDIWDVGKQLLEGLWTGISNAAEWLWDQVTGLGSTLVSKIKGVFGIASPSKVFRDEIGAMLGEGLALGITGEIPGVLRAATELGDAMFDALSGYSSPKISLGMSGSVGGYGDASGRGTLPAGASIGYGSVTVNVYGTEGMSVRELAQEVEKVITQSIRTREAAWA